MSMGRGMGMGMGMSMGMGTGMGMAGLQPASGLAVGRVGPASSYAGQPVTRRIK